MNKRMPSFALPLLLLIASVVRAEVKVPAECRIKNRPPGRCGWCCLETLARYLKIKALYGLTEHNASRCDVGNLETVLVDSEIPYRVQYPGTHNQAILRHAVHENLGAVVGFRELYPGAGGHIVTLVDLTENGVQVIDPNDTDGRTRRMTLERFLYWWDGFALVLESKSDVKLAAE
jgi:ABC-type bacteriocin/lantibiotic exporter with double-glycine peptidase domain